MTLLPCDACRRHVRCSETACPFCGAPLQPSAPRVVRDVSRMSRAAQLALGAALLAGCGSEPTPGPGVPTPPVADADAGAGDPDPGGVVAMYGAPAEPLPAPTTGPEGATPSPTPGDTGTPAPMYGLPPRR